MTNPTDMKNAIQAAAKITLSKLLLDAMGSPGFLALAADWDRVRTQAKAAGVIEEFDLAFHYEVERAREYLGHALEPAKVLQIVVKVAGS